MTDASEQAAYDAQIVSDASSYKLFKLFTAAACSLSLRCPETPIWRARNEDETANLIPALGKTDLQKTVIYGMPVLRVYVG
jgi:hypothetical protein